MILTHRFIYEYLHGPISAELEIDHKCRNHSCANPEHLEAVSHQENMLRGINHQREKTHCLQGHEYSLTNTYHRPTGGRDCRICKRDNDRRYRLNQKMQVQEN